MTSMAPAGGSARRPLAVLPSALDAVDEIVGRLRQGQPAFFLDFDGTLAPITPDPADTVLPPETRSAIEALRSVSPVAIVSGRDLEDVRHLVGLDGIYYAGSHGFDVLEPDGRSRQRGREFQPDLNRAASELERLLTSIPGAFVERKGFAVAVHYRQLENPGDRFILEGTVDKVVNREPRLRVTAGKKIFEVRPDVDWDKGKAVSMMVGLVDTADPVVPLYMGDDLTDEDAFEAVAGSGVGVVVRGEEDDRETTASYVIEVQERVREFLERLEEELE